MRPYAQQNAKIGEMSMPDDDKDFGGFNKLMTSLENALQSVLK